MFRSGVISTTVPPLLLLSLPLFLLLLLLLLLMPLPLPLLLLPLLLPLLLSLLPPLLLLLLLPPNSAGVGDGSVGDNGGWCGGGGDTLELELELVLGGINPVPPREPIIIISMLLSAPP